MKIISFNCTIEISKDENGYSNNYYMDIDEKGVSVSHPYIKQSSEQVTFINEIVNQIIDDFGHINRRIDAFNCDMKLKQYAPKVVKTEESVPETSEESAVPQVGRGGSDTTDLVAHSEQEQERLDMEEELKEEV